MDVCVVVFIDVDKGIISFDGEVNNFVDFFVVDFVEGFVEDSDVLVEYINWVIMDCVDIGDDFVGVWMFVIYVEVC